MASLLAEFCALLGVLETEAHLAPYERAALLRNLWDSVDTAGLVDELQLQPIWYELLAWQLTARLPEPGQRKGQRFSVANGPLCAVSPELAKGSGFLTYLDRRLAQSISPVHRARYTDILWEYEGGRQRAQAAAAAYLACLPLLRDDEHDAWRNDAVRRALVLAWQVQDAALLTVGKQALLDELTLTRQCDYSALSLQLPLWLLKFREPAIERGDLEAARDFLTGAAATLRAAGGVKLSGARIAYEALAVVERRLGRAAAEWHAQLAIGETLEEEAAASAHSAAIHGMLLEKAYQHYQRIGAADRLAALKAPIRAANRAAAAQAPVRGELLRLDVTRASELARRLAALPAEQSLASYETWAGRLPSLHQTRSWAEEILRERLGLAILPRALFADGRRVASARSAEEQLESWVYELYQLNAQLRSAFTAVILRHLTDAGRWTADALTDYLASGVAFAEASLPMLRTGIERYVARDFISALHVLVPRVEDILRRLLEKLGLPTTTIDTRGVTKEIALGELLKAPALSAGLGEDFSFYLAFLFTEQQGLNLRNDVAHGLLTAQAAHEGAATLVVDVLLRLRTLAITPAAQGAALGPQPQGADRTVVTDVRPSPLAAKAHASDDLPALGSAAFIRAATDRIVHEFHPLRVLLFGSHARGEARPDSDIDLLVVFAAVADRVQAAAAIMQALVDLPIACDVLVTDPLDIEARRDRLGDVLYAALREGRVLYDRE